MSKYKDTIYALSTPTGKSAIAVFRVSGDQSLNILKKISEWPKCIEISSKKLEPHRIPVYLYELASLFHSYWNLGKDV